MTVSGSSSGAWIARIVILVALCATAILAGPKAYAVLAARMGTGPADAPRVDLGRVGLKARPEWLQGVLLEGVLLDLEPILRGDVWLADEVACARLRERLAASPWVEAATFQPSATGQLGVQLALRRPELVVVTAQNIVCLVDATGRVLPPPLRAPDLPKIVLPSPIRDRHFRPGRPCADPRVIAAAAVAVEWRTAVATAVDPPPKLLEIDASNLGGMFLGDPRYSEIAISIDAGKGAAWMQYGRAADAGGPVPSAVKAEVLGRVLEAFPRLDGVRNGDLRLRNRWRDCLVMRAQ